MNSTIKIWYNGSGIIISKIVANQFGVDGGYRIKTEKEFWKILKANMEYNKNAISHLLCSKN